MVRRAIGEPKANVSLTDAQTLVMTHLLAGKTQREAAAEVGVAEETVSRWVNNDPFFIAAMNTRRRELWDANADRLRSLTEKALETVAKVMESSENEALRLRAALEVLKAAGLGAVPLPREQDTEPERVRLALSRRKPSDMEIILADVM